MLVYFKVLLGNFVWLFKIDIVVCVIICFVLVMFFFIINIGFKIWFLYSLSMLYVSVCFICVCLYVVFKFIMRLFGILVMVIFFFFDVIILCNDLIYGYYVGEWYYYF